VGTPTYTGYANAAATPVFIDPPPPSYGNLVGKDDQKRKLKLWVNSEIQYNHPYRLKQWATWTKADYFDANIMWLEPFILGVGGSYRWTPLTFKKEEQGFPTPSFNEFSAPIENEAARLGRPEYQPYVRPTGERPDPKARRGARLAEQVLQDALTDMRWVEEEDLGELHMPLYGGWFVLSYWETNWLETVPIPVQGAVRCPDPSCGTMLASPLVPADQFASAFPETPGAQNVYPDELQPGAPPHVRVTNCPTCAKQVQTATPLAWPATGEPMLDDMGEPQFETATATIPGPKLEPFTPVKDELSASDPFGRAMSQQVPKGNWRLKTISPYDQFVRNLGVDEKPSTLDEFTIVEVVPLDYVRNHFPNGHLVKAEQPAILMMFHPVAGERTIYQGTGAGGPGMFRNHVRLKRKFQKPRMEVPKGEDGKPIENAPAQPNRGRAVVMAGDIVLEDGDYMIESQNNPGTWIPKVHFDYVCWKTRAGGKELQGMSMAENLFDAQESINETLSQYKDAMEREGSPKWLVPREVNFDYEESGEAGAHWVWDGVTDNPNVKPERIESNLMSGEVFNFLNWCIAHVARVSNLNEVEQGNVPAGVTAALALQILAEQSGERRRNRIRRIREMLERLYSHGLQLSHELVREDRLFWLKDETGSWSQKSWSGLQLEGQTDVRIDAEPEHHTPLQRQQRIKDMKDLFPQLFQNPRSLRRLAQQMGYPLEGFEDESLQDEAAQREFSRFLDEGRPPVIDGDLDDHAEHHEQHGSNFMDERWLDLEDESGWDQALPFIGQWQAFMQMLDGHPADPGSMGDPAQGIPPRPPTPEAPPLWQKPPSFELQVCECWRMMLQRVMQNPAQLGYQFDTGGQTPILTWERQGYANAPPLLKILRMRAHDTCHKLYGQPQMVQEAAGQPEAPGGTQPQQAAPPQQPQQQYAGQQ
jgi:hypothetical protein